MLCQKGKYIGDLSHLIQALYLTFFNTGGASPNTEALAGKKGVGAAAGKRHTAVWTEAGELFTFGYGGKGQLGHGVEGENELVPRQVEALAGKKVIGVAAGYECTTVWTEAGELFTLGDGENGQLGHGDR